MQPQDSSLQPAPPPRPGIPFAWQWGLVSAGGFVIAALPVGLAAAGISELENVVLSYGRGAALPYLGLRQALILALYIVTCLIPGAVMGTGHWLLLRRRVPRAGWWVLSEAAGLALALGALLLVFVPWSIVPGMTALGLVLPYRLLALGLGGALFGLARWLSLRRWARRAWVCMPTTALAWSPFIAIFLTSWDCAEPMSGISGCPDWFEGLLCLGPVGGPLFFIVVTSWVMGSLLAPGNLLGAGSGRPV